MHNCKKLPFEIHLLISTNKSYVARKWPDFSRYSNWSWASLEARDPFPCYTERRSTTLPRTCSCHHGLKESCSVNATGGRPGTATEAGGKFSELAREGWKPSGASTASPRRSEFPESHESSRLNVLLRRLSTAAPCSNDANVIHSNEQLCCSI